MDFSSSLERIKERLMKNIILSITLVLNLMSFQDCNAQTATAYNIEENTLTQDETNGLLQMREEEKLAHDVYVYFYENYGLNVFNNISESEARHMDAVLEILKSYKIHDPATNTAGTFTNSDIQALYNKLTAEGTNEAAALKVGAYIEELDIEDLKILIKKTENTYISEVYTNLLNGSKNHLQAFVRNLSKRLVNYQPQILTTEEYNNIIAVN